MSAIIKRKEGGFEFKSEAELESFVFSHLNRLLNLLPIVSQYRIGSEICDILATDNQNNLSIIELKNTQDRYIVQQLTRYYHSLIERKPRFEGVDYNKPIKLIAIAPSFHAHNFIDIKYTNLHIDFFTFELVTNSSTGDILFELTNFDTKAKYIEKIPQIDRRRVLTKQITEKAEIDYDEMIDYYMRLNHSSELKIEPLQPERFRELSEKYKSKCTKKFKIIFEFFKKSGTIQTSATVKLPSKVKVIDFYRWCAINLTGGIEGRGSTLRQIHRPRAGVFKVRMWFNE